MKPRKVFSQKLAKAYWITIDLHAPISGLPCFTQRECTKIKELTERGEMDTKGLEWLYTQKIEDWRYNPFPEDPEPIAARIDPLERDPSVVSARETCLAHVFSILKPVPKDDSVG